MSRRVREPNRERYFTRDDPFGPTSSDELPSDLERLGLYDKHNDMSQEVQNEHPSFVIGRRGAGKTAFLRATAMDELDVWLEAHEAVPAVGALIRGLRFENEGAYVERTLPIWHACFVVAILASVWKRGCRLQYDDCPRAFDFGRATISQEKTATAHVVRLLTEATRAAESQRVGNVGDFLNSIMMNGVPYWIAKQELYQAIEIAQCRGVIMVDSLEEYNDAFYSEGIIISHQTLALQGLFKATAQARRSYDDPFRVTVAFPGELWHHYLELSSNPLKDFESNLLLHWTNHELVELAARRLVTFLKTNDPDQAHSLRSQVERHTKKDWARQVLLKYLPPELSNSSGHREDSIAYLLRHTQLLPRHFLLLLNGVFGANDIFPGCISQERMRVKVSEGERLVVNGIVSSFRSLYPTLRFGCESIIPQLNTVFTLEQFERAHQNGERWLDTPTDALSVLVEVGAVGRVAASRQTGLYIRGDFEYLHDRKLRLFPEDSLCIHPLFSKEFHSLSGRSQGEVQASPILPLGSDPTLGVEYSRNIRLAN